MDLVLRGVDLFEHGDAEGRGLSGAVLRAGEDVPAGEGDRDALLLDGAGPLKALLVDAHEELPLEEIVLKLVTLCCCNILNRLQEDAFSPEQKEELFRLRARGP